MSKVLLFHIFPINTWKNVSDRLLAHVPHEDIFVHVSIDPELNNQEEVRSYLSAFPKVRSVFYSINSAHPEVDAMETFRANINFHQYSILTYMHTKGVTKPESQNIEDWTELMRYFVLDKMNLCEKAFKRGYLLYGVNKTPESGNQGHFKGIDFFYAGNFISVNLTAEVVQKIKTLPLPMEYYGLEGFWGKLCTNQQAYNVFYSRINHYVTPFPAYLYKSWIRRTRYSITAFLYQKFYQWRKK